MQVWRLITTFLFFGPLGFGFFFNMLFVFRYCRMLEEGSFRGRKADFVFMFLFGGVLMTVSFWILVGHIYYFLEDVFPNQPGGKRLLLTPSVLKLLLDDPQEDPDYLPLPEEQPEL